MANAIAVRADKVRSILEEKREKIFAAAAAHIRPERFMEQVARACINNPDLTGDDVDWVTLIVAASEAAALGLEIDGVLGHAHLVPFKNNKRGGIREIVLVPGYLGLKELAYRSGMISSIEAAAVYKDDEFDYELGTDKFIKHKPSDSPYGGIPTHVYCIVKTTTHGTVLCVMSWAQFEWHRDKYAKGWRRSDSAYQTNPVAMALKTCVRKALKLCPLSPELQRIMQNEEYAEQPLFPSGTEASVEDLDAAQELENASVLLENEHPSGPTPEELADPEYVGQEQLF